MSAIVGRPRLGAIRLGQGVRRVKEAGLKEVASTRTLVSAGLLIGAGLSFTEAANAAIAGPLTDDVELQNGLIAMIESYAAGDAPAG